MKMPDNKADMVTGWKKVEASIGLSWLNLELGYVLS